MIQQDPAKLSVADRLRLSAQRSRNVFEESMANAICFVVLEKSIPLHFVREMDVASFMVLLDFIEEQNKEMEKKMKKSKSGK